MFNFADKVGKTASEGILKRYAECFAPTKICKKKQFIESAPI